MILFIGLGVFVLLFVPFFRQLVFTHLPKMPKLLFYLVKDAYKYLRYQEWKIYKGFGLHIWVGLFGKGKTVAMIASAYAQAVKYPHINIYSNIDLKGFPNPERVHRLTNYMQIVDSPGDSLYLIDEISTLFQSRSWANFPMPLLSQLLQVRKNKKMIYATAQRFTHVDKLIRDVTYSVIDANCIMSRYDTCKWYIAEDWENKNVMNIPVPYAYTTFVQTDFIRNLFDTYEIVGNVQKDAFLTQEEILTRQAGGSNVTVINADKKPLKRKMG